MTAPYASPSPSATRKTPPPDLPDTIEPRSAALLEIWAPNPADQPVDAA